MSDTHVRGGTITSPPCGNLSFNKLRDNKFADDPELTNTEYFLPSQSDQRCSNSSVNLSLVSFGYVDNHLHKLSISKFVIVSLANLICFYIYCLY